MNYASNKTKAKQEKWIYEFIDSDDRKCLEQMLEIQTERMREVEINAQRG